MQQSGLIPQTLRSRLSPARLNVIAEFVRFGGAGVVGFVVDTATVYGTRYWLGLYGAGVLAYLLAATTTWAVNRVWAFRGRGGGPAHRQWARFLIANSIGFVLNRGTYAILITVSTICARQPVFAIFAGMLAGMFVNFSLSRRWVFR
jgi:putative flippase GtrA